MMKNENSKYWTSDKNPNKPVTTQVKGARAQKQFMLDWLSDNQQTFMELMEDAREQDPRLYITTYTTIMKHVVPQDKNVNVNVGINKDFLELQAMGKTRIADASNTQAALPEMTHFTQYEEIVAEEHRTQPLSEI